MSHDQELRLRLLTLEDLEWVLAVNEATSSELAPSLGFDLPALADDLDSGRWASDDTWGWAIVADGTPVGFVLLVDLSIGDAVLHIRLSPDSRGRGIGRAVLRLVADHHFADDDALARIAGNVHEGNIAMQRAFNAAGFRMEARYRDWVSAAEGRRADLWSYALTRRDWEQGRHQLDDGYDLHGLVFRVDEVLEGPTVGSHGLVFRFLQEGCRVTATFDSHQVSDGELAGILDGDVVRYRYVQDYLKVTDGTLVQGTGTLQLQRGSDGGVLVVNNWVDDDGRSGRTLLRDAETPPADEVHATPVPPPDLAHHGEPPTEASA